MNLFNIMASAASGNKGMLGTMYQAYQIAQTVQQTRAGIRDLLERNNIQIRDMMPYLAQGTKTRTAMDKYLPKGYSDKIQTFATTMMGEQESGKPSSGPIIDVPPTKSAGQEGGSSWHSAVGNRFPPLKNR